MSRKMPSPSTVLFGCLTGIEHVELLTGVTQHHCFHLVHDACCPTGHCGIWFEWGFQVLHTSSLRYSETSLRLIPCFRPELIGAECCDIHAVFEPLSASLVACRLWHLSSSVNSFTYAHRGVELCRCVMFPSCPSFFFFFSFSLVALAA